MIRLIPIAALAALILHLPAQDKPRRQWWDNHVDPMKGRKGVEVSANKMTCGG